MAGTGGSGAVQIRRETRLGGRHVANPVESGGVTSINVQAAVAAQGGILQSVVISGGPVQTGGTCANHSLNVIGSDGNFWVLTGHDVRTEAADPSVGIVGSVFVQACAPGGRGDVAWTYTVAVP